MFELRPAILYEEGLLAAVRVLAEQTAREVGATASVRCHAARYHRAIEALAYGAVREALANVRKHSHATSIVVSIAEDDQGMVVGEIHDNGEGFDHTAVRSRPNAALHIGLESLVERIHVACGEATITTTPGRGTSVRFSIPLAASTASITAASRP